MASCLRASSSVRHIEGVGSDQGIPERFRPCPHPCGRSPMTVRGGGVPAGSMAFTPLVRMGPPPRSLLPMRILHHGLGLWPARIQACGTKLRAPTRSSPRTCHPRHAQVCRRARSRPRTSPSGGATRTSLTASARADSHLIVGRGEETGCPGRTRKLRDKKLDRTLGAPP